MCTVILYYVSLAQNVYCNFILCQSCTKCVL